MLSAGKEDELNKIIQRVNEFETKGKFKQAIDELQKVVKINPKNGNVFNRLGDLYIKDDKIDEATTAYEKGVEAFRKDKFARNALALCKKILRHNPGKIETNLDIAELLVDLDEKSDAIIYFFSYIDKQLAQKNTKEALEAVESVKNLELFNGKVVRKINEVYNVLGRNDLAKKFAEELLKEDTTIEDITMLSTPVAAPKTKPPKKEETKRVKSVAVTENIAINKEPAPSQVENEIKHLDAAVSDIESAVAQLRKAMRIDEVIVALEGSLTSLSDDHKKAIALMQKSLQINLNTLEKSIKEFRENSGQNIKDLETLLRNLNQALADLNRNQSLLSKDMSDNLRQMSSSFNSTTRDAMRDINKALTGFQKSSSDMCAKLDETKDCNVSILGINEDIKVSLQKMNESMLKFMMAQESKEKKQGRFALIVIVIVAVISGLLVLQLFI
ncbi:MAG: tetratricopeptide repeat protein [bacterium]